MWRSFAATAAVGLVCILGCNGANQVSDPPIPTDSVEPTGSSGAGAASKAPRQFDVKFETTKGDFVVRFTRAWAPLGVARMHELVESGFFNDAAFFRVVPGFVVQFGINGDPEIQGKWRDMNFPDDPVRESNKRGTLSFATSGPDSRSTQLFINLGDNPNLDGMGFSPIGVVVEGMDVVDSINSEYGEQPDQQRIQFQGNAYLKQQFPNLDYVKKTTIVSVEE